jgi:hypothetical protein
MTRRFQVSKISGPGVLELEEKAMATDDKI